MRTPLSPSVRLRVMTQDDLELVLMWRNHPKVRQHMYMRNEISFDEHSSWFKRASVDPDRHLLILKIDDESRGYVNFCCDEGRAAVWGFYLAPDAPKGTGQLLGKAATSYAFEMLGLERIWGEVLIDNVASQNFHLRQGFVLQTIVSDKAVGEKRLENIRRYLLTRDAWRARQGAT
jgi:UDP-4-amino-4,6-dideoxy-N-acetyl-beta-L-altrosamine N-acetyltransferase